MKLPLRYEREWGVIKDADNDVVFLLMPIRRDDEGAERIVAAVNAHEALVEACKELYTYAVSGECPAGDTNAMLLRTGAVIAACKSHA